MLNLNMRGISKMSVTRGVYFNAAMDQQEALIRAYMRLQPEWANRDVIPRNRVVSFALALWAEQPQIDIDAVQDWYRVVDNRDRDEKMTGAVHKHALYISVQMYDAVQVIGQRIADTGIKIKALISTSQAGAYNLRLISALAMERLTRIIQAEHPDLQPEA